MRIRPCEFLLSGAPRLVWPPPVAVARGSLPWPGKSLSSEAKAHRVTESGMNKFFFANKIHLFANFLAFSPSGVSFSLSGVSYSPGSTPAARASSQWQTLPRNY